MDQKAIGRRIKAARERKGLTQEELAEEVDLSPMHVSVIERGVKLPKLETLINIANALDVSADVLLQDVVNNQTKLNLVILLLLTTTGESWISIPTPDLTAVKKQWHQ